MEKGAGDVGAKALPKDRRQRRASCWLNGFESRSPADSCTSGSSSDGSDASSTRMSWAWGRFYENVLAEIYG
jgi:hypothetical protein